MRKVRLVAWPVSTVIWAIYALWRSQALPEGRDRLSLFAAMPFALILGYGLALIAVLAWSHRDTWRTVLRPRRGSILGAICLGFVTPYGVFDWVPGIMGVLGLVFTFTAELSVPFYGLAILLLPGLAWYPIAALLVVGIARRLARVAAFVLMFWASYSAVLLWAGHLTFF